jgi:hypothetical protein
MKILFFKLAAIAAGVVFALTVLLGGIYWYSTRPVPEKSWDVSAFTADGPPDFRQDGDGYITFTYGVKNHTDRDFNEESNYRYKLLVVRPDKSLTNPIPTDKGTASVETPVFIPAHQSGTIRIKIRASLARKAGLSDDAFQEELRKYLMAIMHGGEYFALFDEERHYRINLPAVIENNRPKP